MLLNAETPTVVRANAGTGKTYQLSNRFLLLLALGAAPESILATTFTRKAAAEIQSRIFVRLAGAASSDEAARTLGSALGLQEFNRARAQELLTSLVAAQHRLGLCTLDGFCVRLLRMFAFELGFANGAVIASSEVNASIRREAIRKLFADQDSDDLYTLLRLSAGDRDKYSLHRRVDMLVGGLHEAFQESELAHWSTICGPDPLPGVALEKAIAKIETLAPILKKDGTPNATVLKSLRGDIERAQKSVWRDFFTSGIAAKIALDEPEFSRIPIPPEYLAVYQPLIEHARAKLLADHRQKNIATYRLLEHFDGAYNAEIFDRSALHFGAIKDLLAKSALSSELDELYYRLDSVYSHLLLDEFQDTSLAEWRLLAPVAEEILSKAGVEATFFCVGDVKQAIYGWRGGKAEIFDSITDRWPHVHAETMEKSYRSAPMVVNFANKIFLPIEENAALEEYSDIVSTWRKGFVEHTTAREELAGFVRIEFVSPPKDDLTSLSQTLAERAAAIVKDIIAKNPAVSIGVLVPRNRDVNAMMREFAKPEVAIQASEEGGSPLTDTRAVLAVLALCTFIDHPGDTVARFHIASSPLATGIGLSDWKNDAEAFRIAGKQRDLLFTRGYGKLILDLISATKEVWSAHEWRRLLQLTELGFAFDARRTFRALDFVRFVTLEKIQNSSPGAVRVMTVHKSKGLEFDAVVLPYLNAPWFGKNSAPLWSYRASPLAPPSEVSLSVPSDLVNLHPAFERLSRQAKEARALEALNVLYVGLTRPRHALYGLIPEDYGQRGATSLSNATVLRAALEQISAADAVESKILYSSGTSDWAERIDVSPVPVIKREHIPNKITFQKQKNSARPMLDSVLANSNVQPLQTCKQLFLDRNDGIRSAVLCKILRSIEWLKDGVIAEQLLETILRRCRISAEVREQYREDTRMILANDAVRAWFDKERIHDPKQKIILHRNLPFSQSRNDSRLNGSLDRVLVQRSGDSVDSVNVVMFAPEPTRSSDSAVTEAGQRVELEVYRDVAARLFDIPAKAVQVTQFFPLGNRTVLL